MTVQLRSIGFDLAETVDAIRASAGNGLSSHAFPCLYLWQEQMGLSIHAEKDFFVVKCDARGENAWFFPCGSEEKTKAFIRDGMREADFSLCYLGDRDAAWLDGHFPDTFVLSREEDADEYVCRIEDYVTMVGGAYRRVRNRLHHLERAYTVEAARLSSDNIQAALSLLDTWTRTAHNNQGYILSDNTESVRALTERAELGMDGVLLSLNGAPVAVVAGFPLNEHILDAVVGKCLYEAPPGTMHCALRAYMALCGEGYTFCNVEEDMGIVGLRTLKEEMRPAYKNHIWTAHV